MTTRGEVLTELRRLGYQVTCGDLAEIMGRPSYSVGNALTALYSRDLIDRTPVVGANQKFVYRAKAVVA
jgi:predicted transcriptional regulator